MPEPGSPLDVAARADEALALVGVAADEAERLARSVLQHADKQRDAAALVKAWRTLGLVAGDRGDLPTAEASLRSAILAARRADAASMAEARMTLAFVLLRRGQAVAARRLARSAVAALTGTEQARARIQLALVEQRTGALQQSLSTYAAALQQVRRSGDRLLEAKLRNNRGILLAYQGQPRAAERDLTTAEALFRQLGQDVFAADASWNVGFAAGLRGDSVAALRQFDEAGAALEAAGVSRGVRFLDEGAVLLSVGLIEPALEAVTAGIHDLATAGDGSDVAEAQLMLSEIYLARGDAVAATAAAREASAAFAAQGRVGFGLLADFALLRATVDEPAEPAWVRAAATAEALAEAGWPASATEVELLVTRRGLASGRQLPADSLDRALAAARSGPAGQRLRAWHIVALVRLSRGQTSGASRALLAGLRQHDLHRASLAATELQVHSAARARELSELGLSLAVTAGRPSRVFDWAERWRAGSLLSRPVRPPKDPAMAARLAELRAVSADLELARLTGDDLGRLQRRQQLLERSVAARARSLRAEVLRESTVPLPQVLAALGGRVLVEFLRTGSAFSALVVTDRQTRLVRLADVDEVSAELQALRGGLGRLALGGSARVLTATEASVRVAAQRLDAALLAPLLARLEDRPLVLVPTGDLHALPWALLATAADRPVTVAPSASVWWHAARRRVATGSPVVVVSGPGLAGARTEAAAVAAAYGGAAHLMQDDGATVAAVTASLDGAGYAHLAAHGSFRADNPLFSSLRLADGPLTVHDLETLHRAPSVVVLSACDSGLSAVHPGDELMGLTGSLLRIGTRTLVASVAPVPDAVALRTMIAFHRAVRAGSAPADALVLARSGLDVADRVAAASFVCFGAG